jgi:hypothetical protein
VTPALLGLGTIALVYLLASLVVDLATRKPRHRGRAWKGTEVRVGGKVPGRWM